MAKFNYQKAKEAGYSEEEITQFLAKEKPDFNVKKAKESGYSQEEINTFLSSQAEKEKAGTLKSSAKEFARNIVPAARRTMGIDQITSMLPEEDVRRLRESGLMKSGEEIEKELPERLNQEDINYLTHLSGKLGKEIPDIIAAFANFKLLPSRKGPSPKGPKKGTIEVLPPEEPPPSEGAPPEVGEPVVAEPALKATRPPEPSPIAPQQPQYAPEAPKISAPEKFLKSDFEIAQSIHQALSPLKMEAERVSPKLPATISTIFRPVEEELNALSEQRVIKPRFIGREAARAVQRVSERIYQQNTANWREAEALASDEIFPRRQLVEDLRSIAMESPSRPAGGEAKLQNFAQDLLDRLERRRGNRTQMMSMSNADLIKEIKQARVGYDYRYSGGVQGHRINEFINAVEQELIRSSSEESRNALLRAREGSRNWAQRFKDPAVLPFRSRGLSKPQKNYSSLTNPDTFNIISDILEQDERGRTVLNLVRRNMLEEALEPFLLRPQSFNPAEFDREMSKFEGIIPQDVLNSVGQKVYSSAFNAINQPQKIEKAPSFANISEAQVSAKLRTIEGLRQLKKELSLVTGGQELYEEIAGTMGVDLLFGGQMDVPANADRIRKMINDRNGRPYIKETLGKDNLSVLDELVKKNQLQKRLMEIKENPELASIAQSREIIFKAGKIIYYLLKGSPVSAINQFMSIQKKMAKAKDKEAKQESPREKAEDIEIR